MPRPTIALLTAALKVFDGPDQPRYLATRTGWPLTAPTPAPSASAHVPITAAKTPAGARPKHYAKAGPIAVWHD